MAALGAGRSAGQAAPKKLVIKPLKLKPQLPDNFEDVTWAKLQVRGRLGAGRLSADLGRSIAWWW